MGNIIIRTIQKQDYRELRSLTMFKPVEPNIYKYKTLQKYCLVAIDATTSIAVGFILGEVNKLNSCFI